MLQITLIIVVSLLLARALFLIVSLSRKVEDGKLEEVTARERLLASERLVQELRQMQQNQSRDEEERRRKDLEAQEARHREQLQQMKTAFENFTSRSSDQFKEKSAMAISELMKPVQEKFQQFSQAVRESQKDAIDMHGRLEQKIDDLEKRSQSVGDEARNLANALSGYSKVQGDFGEMMLTTLLKQAGLVEGVQFETQSVITDEAGHEVKNDEGRTMIPDVIVHYPDDTSVIVDSKVSLSAYKAFCAAVSVEEREKFAKEHILSVRKHIEELRSKDYAGHIPEGRRKVDFNIMFIPVEGAFTLMLEREPTLWQEARKVNVLIVSQMTLIIVLNMIQVAWRQHEQERNIQEVYRTGGELMSQIRAWLDNFTQVGEQLKKAQEAYDESRNRLVGDRVGVVRKIEKLEALGLRPKASKARIRPGARRSGPESVIPSSLQSEGGIAAQEDDGEENDI